MKIKQENDVADLIGLIYIETKTELLGRIWSSGVYDEHQTR